MGVPAEVFDDARLSAVAASGLLDTPAEAAFDDLARLAAELIDAPLAFVTVVDDRRSFWKSAIGVDDGTRQNTVEQSFCQYVVGGEDPLVVTDAANDPRTADNPSVESMGVAAWAGYPVRTPDGHVLGTFCVVDVECREWTERDLEILDVLSSAASREVALRMRTQEATEVAEHARSVTQTLQESLLPPSLPEIPGLEISAWHRPAFEGDVVLGDFYDVFPTGDGRWGCVVGDVCGHGAHAAKRTGLARYTVRAAAAASAMPAEVLALLNEALLVDGDGPADFVTAVYATVEPAPSGAVVRVANGGHPHPALRRADGSAEMLDLPGALLGVFDDYEVSGRDVELGPGDVLVLYTDGLTEAKGADGLFGDERVLRALADAQTPTEATKALAEAVISYADGRHGDDIAMLAIGVAG